MRRLIARRAYVRALESPEIQSLKRMKVEVIQARRRTLNQIAYGALNWRRKSDGTFEPIIEPQMSTATYDDTIRKITDMMAEVIGPPALIYQEMCLARKPHRR